MTKIKSHAHKKGTYSKEEWKVGEHMYCDTMGPFAKSIGGAKYASITIDRTSGYSITVVTPGKDTIGKATIGGVKEIFRISGVRGKVVQMDGDGPYTSAVMRQDLQNLGIRPMYSSPYDSAQNGLAEVSVKTHIDDASVLMFSSGVPTNLWSEALSCAEFVRNNIPSQQRGDKWLSPFQLLSGRASAFNPSRFMPFGAKTIVQEPKSQRHGPKGLSQRKAWVGAFVGYGGPFGYGGAYRIYDPVSQGVRHVSMNFCVVDEMSMIFKIDRDLVAGKFHLPVDFQITPEALLDPEELARYGLSHDEILELSPVLSEPSHSIFRGDHARDEVAATLREVQRFSLPSVPRAQPTQDFLDAAAEDYTRVDFSGVHAPRPVCPAASSHWEQLLLSLDLQCLRFSGVRCRRKSTSTAQSKCLI
jgi:hypothetical protein